MKFKLIIIVVILSILFESCSSSFYKNENRQIENQITISNNLNENLEIKSIRNNTFGTEQIVLLLPYSNTQYKENTISLKNAPKKFTLLCYSPNSDTGIVEITKTPRKQAIILNILATPLFLGLNWIPEILSPSFYRIDKKQSKIHLSNLKYNEKYIEGKFNDRFKKYNYDSLIDLVSKFNYSHKIELFKRAIDSIEYQKIKNSIDTNQFKYFEQKTLSLFYKKKVEYNIKQIREIFNFQNSNQNSKSQIVFDFYNSYKDNNFKYLLENLYITNKNRELLKNYEHREAIELLKFTNEIAIHRQSNTSLGTEYKLIQKKYNQSILKDLKSQLKNKKDFYANYVLLDSIIFNYKNQKFLFTSVLDSIENYLFENRFAYIQNELSICQTQECQQKTFSSFKENLNYPILSKNLGTYIYENLQFITNKNDFTLYYEANEDCSFIVESEYSKISKFQYKSVNAKKHRCVFILDKSNSKHPLKEINVYNEFGKLCIKTKPTDSKFFASKNQYFKDGKIVGVQYIYKKHNVNNLLNSANFVYDEKGNVENTKPIILSIENFFKNIKSFDSLGTTQLSELSNQFRKTKLDLDTFLEIPEFSSIFTLLNSYEMKISNAFKKAEIREKVNQESLLSKKHDSKIKTIFDKIMTEVSEKKLIQKDISKLILTQHEKLGESIGHKLTEDESKYFYKLIGEYTKEYQKQIELYNLLYSNKNSINSQGSTNQQQQQAQSGPKYCQRCNGSGNVDCGTCGGHGQIECKACYGKGYCSTCPGQRCVRCGITGRQSCDRLSMGACKGKKDCFDCNGTGKVE